MKPYLFLLCLTGVVPVILSLLRPVPHKYYLNMTKVTWPVAQNYCRETYADMATVESNLDWVKLEAEVTREHLTDIAWVGLYNDIDSWRWSFNDVPLKDAFQSWGINQPDNKDGDESCCMMNRLGNWKDYPCTDLFPFICYNANNSYADRFVGVTSLLTWSEAQAYCREFHTDLATAFNETDNSEIDSIVSKQGFSWIGLYRNTWMWSDGTKASNILWLSGQPDNDYGDENCAVLNNGMFEDTKCDKLHYFICHITQPVTEQQIVKLQVKSETMFDSAVQSSILELIKKELEENGMLENTTVTWRVKSDGQVFHKKKYPDKHKENMQTPPTKTPVCHEV